jgi:hypothetical protein
MLTETDVRPVGNDRIKEEIERQYNQGNKEEYGAGEYACKSNFNGAFNIIPLNRSIGLRETLYFSWGIERESSSGNWPPRVNSQP